MDPEVRGPDLLRSPGRFVNPSTVGGLVAVAMGLVLVLVPAISVDLAETVVGLGLLFSGGNDLWTATRRHDARATARAAALLRGLASVVLAGVFLLSFRDALDATLLLGGAYLLFRSAVNLVLAAFSRDHDRRTPRAASGAVGLVLGLLVIAAPEIVVDWFTVTLGLAALCGGAVTLTYGYRVATGITSPPEGASRRSPRSCGGGSSTSTWAPAVVPSWPSSSTSSVPSGRRSRWPGGPCWSSACASPPSRCCRTRPPW